MLTADSTENGIQQRNSRMVFLIWQTLVVIVIVTYCLCTLNPVACIHQNAHYCHSRSCWPATTISFAMCNSSVSVLDCTSLAPLIQNLIPLNWKLKNFQTADMLLHLLQTAAAAAAAAVAVAAKTWTTTTTRRRWFVSFNVSYHATFQRLLPCNISTSLTMQHFNVSYHATFQRLLSCNISTSLTIHHFSFSYHTPFQDPRLMAVRFCPTFPGNWKLWPVCNF